ncbi:uncharacterized protein LOC144862737 [Branchiostoma floridae x Branchiostoma japonicum]
MRWKEPLCIATLLLVAMVTVTEARVPGKLMVVSRVRRDVNTTMATTLAPDGSLLDPNGPHVCTRRITESRTVRETYRQPYTTLTTRCIYFLCFQQPKTAYRQAYRSVVKSTIVTKRACCPGYYQEGDSCEPSCYMCVHGTCTAPDVCTCEEGYVGQQCRCDGQHYGSNCELSCDCENGGTCGGDDSQCFCPPGYSGDRCENQCPEGTYGASCDNRCTCENGVCDHVTGECQCNEGYTGPRCNEACEDPNGCLQCPCLNGGTCDSNGACVCAAGFKGDVCGEPCDAGTYGAHCASSCLCHHGGSCDPVTGQCSCPSGYIGENCEQECEVGRYGDGCAQSCDCQNGGTCTSGGQCLCKMGWHGNKCQGNICPYQPPQYSSEHYTDEFHWPYCIPCHCNQDNTESCHPWGGHCECNPGWGGVNCDTICAEGFWGKGCTTLCDCAGSHCDPVDGRCLCPAGYTGSRCNETCPEGQYGSGCAESCSCENGGRCSPLDGSCTCLPGWTGYRCNEPCPKGMYGLRCNSTCECQNESWCNPANGTCTCRPGFTGVKCDMPCQNMTYGQDCAMRCNCSDHANSCDRQTGQCVCKEGWRGERCDSNCAPNRWGANCAQTCTCENSGTCHATLGTCECPLGYMGDRCQTACPEGRFGYQCKGVCSERCQNDASCNTITGECICAPGFTGPFCSERCPGGYYGDQCSQVCSCQNGTCDNVDGSCTCLPGWTGSDCAQKCPSGRWGQNCRQTCDHCRNDASCLPWDGTCICTAGWAGPQCAEACPAGYYGENCNSACNCVHGVCDHIRGTCTCDAGWTGSVCNFDVNECTRQDNECNDNAICHNSPGSYRCVCRPGYVGDGRECQPNSVRPVILRPLPILERETEDNVLFSCRYEYSPSAGGRNVFVTWLKGDIVLFLGELRRIDDERFTINYGDGMSDLTIRQTRLSDSGPYTCLINSVPPTNSTGILNIKCPEGSYGSECKVCPCQHGREMCDPYNGCLPCKDEQACKRVLKTFDGSIRITSESWRPELADKTTTDNQKLAGVVEYGLNEIYRKSPLSGDYLNAKVKQFSEGSVVSDFTLYFRPGADVRAEDVGEQLDRVVNIGGLKVDQTANGIEGDSAKRDGPDRNGDGDRDGDGDGRPIKAGAVAGAVIGVALIVLLVVLAFLAFRYLRLRKRPTEPTVSYDRGTTSIGADNPVYENMPGAMAAPLPGVQVHKGEHLMYMNNPLYDQVNGMGAPEKAAGMDLSPPGAEAPPPYEENPAELQQLTEEEQLKLKQKAAEAGYPE